MYLDIITIATIFWISNKIHWIKIRRYRQVVVFKCRLARLLGTLRVC